MSNAVDELHDSYPYHAETSTEMEDTAYHAGSLAVLQFHEISRTDSDNHTGNEYSDTEPITTPSGVLCLNEYFETDDVSYLISLSRSQKAQVASGLIDYLHAIGAHPNAGKVLEARRHALIYTVADDISWDSAAKSVSQDKSTALKMHRKALRSFKSQTSQEEREKLLQTLLDEADGQFEAPNPVILPEGMKTLDGFFEMDDKGIYHTLSLEQKIEIAANLTTILRNRNCIHVEEEFFERTRFGMVQRIAHNMTWQDISIFAGLSSNSYAKLSLAAQERFRTQLNVRERQEMLMALINQPDSDIVAEWLEPPVPAGLVTLQEYAGIDLSTKFRELSREQITQIAITLIDLIATLNRKSVDETQDSLRRQILISRFADNMPWYQIDKSLAIKSSAKKNDYLLKFFTRKISAENRAQIFTLLIENPELTSTEIRSLVDVNHHPEKPKVMEKVSELNKNDVTDIPTKVQRGNKRVKRSKQVTSVSSDSVRIYLNQIGKTELLSAEEEKELSKVIHIGQRAAEQLAAGNDDPELHRQLREYTAAKDRFIRANLRLVVSIARRYPLPHGMEMLDLIQEGNLGLEHAVDKFDWRKGFKFSTYATYWIRQAITRGLDTKGSLIRLPTERSASLRTALRQNFGEIERLDAENAGYWRLSNSVSLDKPVNEVGESSLGDLLADNQDSPEDQVVASVDNSLALAYLSKLDDRQKYAVMARFGFLDGERKGFEEIARNLGVTREAARRLVNRSIAKMHPDFIPLKLGRKKNS